MLQCAKTFNDDDVKKACYEFLSKQKVSALHKVMQDLGPEEALPILQMKATMLENCLENVSPQFIGALDCMVYLWMNSSVQNTPLLCPGHYTRDGKANATVESRVNCEGCKAMWARMETSAVTGQTGRHGRKYFYSSANGLNFTENLPNVIQDMTTFLKQK